jgi:hypothetical protein
MKSVFAIEVTDTALNVISVGFGPSPSCGWATEEAILVG